MIAWSRRYPILLLLLLCVLSLDSLAPAQTMTIRLVNGKTGKPLAKKDVTVSFWRDDPSLRKGVAGVQVKGEEWVNISLDKHGIGLIDLPPLATKVQVVAGFREGRVDNIRIRYRLCKLIGIQSTLKSANLQYVSLDEITTHGFIPETDCTPKLPVHAAPGEYVVMAVPYTCWPMCGFDVP